MCIYNLPTDAFRFSGLGEFNVMLTVERMQKMQRAANDVGLQNPARILCDEMDASKVHLWMSQRKHERLVSGPPSQMLLGDPVEEEDDDELASVFDMDEDGVVL